MSVEPERSAVAETISKLAEDIARVAPDCADKAMKIVEIAQLVGQAPDRDLIQDAIESKLLDGEMSDSQIQSTTSAVMSAIRRGG